MHERLHMQVDGEATNVGKRIGLAAGPLLFAVCLLLPTPPDVPTKAWYVVALALWMVAWWVTEAVPMAATSLLPAVVPPLMGVMDATDAASPYADPVIFLMLGGFLIAAALQKWGLHRRFALALMRVLGQSPARLLLGLMSASAFLSMWISNTATVMMMLPMGLALASQLATVEKTKRGLGFSTALMLGIAYAASAGGIATLIGSPPNAIMAGVAEASLGRRLGFGEWLVFALPISLVLLVAIWAYLILMVRRRGVTLRGDTRTWIAAERSALGRATGAEWRVVAVFALVAIAWIIRPFLLEPIVPSLSDTTIVLVGALLLFVLPAGRWSGERLLDWAATRQVEYGVLILMGGGLSLARAVKISGLGEWIASSLGSLDVMETGVVVLITATIVTLLTQFVSNTAIATLFLPIAISLGEALGTPALPLMGTVAVAASAAFMTPVGTPPNAIVFSSGQVTMGQMARTGLVINIFSVLFITFMSIFWSPVVWR